MTCDPSRNASSPASGSTSDLSLARPLLWSAAAAVAVRLPYLLEAVGSVFFGVLILDEVFYDLVAMRLATGEPITDVNPGFRSLLYPALVATCRWLGGEYWLFLTLAAQHALGVATSVLVAFYAGKLFQRRTAALFAGVLYSLAGPPLFYESRLLITTLFTFLVVALLVVLGGCSTHAINAAGLRRWAAAGALLAVAAQARPNALVYLLALPLVVSVGSPRRTGRWRGHLPWLTAVAGCLAALVAIATLQTPIVGDFRLLPTAGGVNLYLGNERGADGMVPRQDRHAVYGDVYRDSVQLFAAEEFEREKGRNGTPREVSRYWVARTASEFAADPLGRLALLGRKAWLLIWPAEVPNNLGFEFVAAHESEILGWLPVRWIWLLPLATAGAWIAYRRCSDRERFRLACLVSLGGLHALTVIAFFVAGRFRIPLWPLVSILAAGALVTLLDALRRRSGFGRRDGLIAIGLCLATFVVGQVNWPGVRLPTHARDHFYRSVARYQVGDLDGSLADAQRAVELEPGNPQALFQLGTVALAREDWTLAETALFEASTRLHVEPRPFNNLGIALERQGHHGDAYASYLRSIEVGPDFSPAWVNAALLELRAGRIDLAAQKIARAEKLERDAGHRTVYTLAARAFLGRDSGHDEAAKRAWAEAEALDSELARKLLQDNALRLELRTEIGADQGGRPASESP